MQYLTNPVHILSRNLKYRLSVRDQLGLFKDILEFLLKSVVFKSRGGLLIQVHDKLPLSITLQSVLTVNFKHAKNAFQYIHKDKERKTGEGYGSQPFTS